MFTLCISLLFTLMIVGETRFIEPEVIRARVQRVLSRYPVIDGHNDLPFSIRNLLKNDVSQLDLQADLSSDGLFSSNPYTNQTDLPRLRKGKVGGQFWSAFISCSRDNPTSKALEQIDLIHSLAEWFPEDLSLAKSSHDVRKAMARGKIASLIGVEGGHMINSSLSVLRSMYRAGARYLTLSHSCNTPWIDASEVDSGKIPTGVNGLSSFGEEVVREMNRLGMLIDLSHVSTAAMHHVLRVSEAPVIFSHSSARAIYNVPRNVPDDVLKMTRYKRGIVMVSLYSCHIAPGCKEDGRGNITDAVRHIDHIRRTASVDNIGLGGDYNGGERFPEGLEDVSKYPDLFEAIITQSDFHWSDEDLAKLANKNILRVMRQVERVRDRKKAEGARPSTRLLDGNLL